MDRSLLPRWFQKMGLAAWLIVGMFLVIIGAVWILDKISNIAEPLIFGAVVAAVGGAGVDYLQTRGWPRPPRRNGRPSAGAGGSTSPCRAAARRWARCIR